MKAIKFFTLFLALAALVGCNQTQQPVAPQADNSQQVADNSREVPLIDMASIKADFDRRVAEHKAQWAKTGHTPGIMGVNTVITVPDDYATIQEAVDNAADGAQIHVKGGDYTEDVVILTPNLNIKATGKATLNGSFSLVANGIAIKGFKIVNTGYAGVLASGVSGAEVKDNTVSGGVLGIVFWSNTGCTIKHNTLSGSVLGITLDHSNGNTIDDNTSSQNSAIGIQLQNDSYENEMSGNTCTSNGRDGIVVSYGSDRNQVKGNGSNGNVLSGFVVYDSHNNAIGSDNTANANGDTGILLLANASGNTVTRNTANGNTNCDIVDAGGGTGNVFIKNRAGCTGGF